MSFADETSSSDGRAVCLALEPDPVMCFLHSPDSTPHKDTAVLICPPFGWEEMTSYRARRRWAQALARAGHPTVRLSLPSTGDSGGSPWDPARLEAWTEAIASTAAWLRASSETDRVAAIGLGLGGLLAYRALANGAAIDDLILWAVQSRGKAMLRELKAHAAMIAARYPADQDGPAAPDGAIELTGFLLSPETAQALGQVQLTELPLPRPQGRRVLLLGRDGLEVAARLRKHLEQVGVAVSVGEGSDWSALVSHPQEAETPEQTIEQTVDWLSSGSLPAPVPSANVPNRELEVESLELVHAGVPIRETPLSLPIEHTQRFAMLSEPASREPGSLCAVLFSAGALPHIGPNRTWVETARRWASQGVPTVRVDLAGIGDSDGDERLLVSNPSLYASKRNAETLAVLDRLSECGLGDRFVLAGLCSGAYWSLHAALADKRVVGALMINLYSFFWSEALVAERSPQDSISALRGGGWTRVVRRDFNAKHVRTVVRSMAPARIRAGARHPVERAQARQVNEALDRLRDQGTQALLLLGEGEPLSGQLLRQGLLGKLERWPNLSVEPIPSRDHMFRAHWLQAHVQDSLDRALERVRAKTAAGQSRAG